MLGGESVAFVVYVGGRRRMVMKTFFTLTVALASMFPGSSSAADDKSRKAGEDEVRLERKCDNEADKERRDEDRDRKHSQRDNKWDEVCAPPAPPPPPPPPVMTDPPPPVLPPPVAPPPPPTPGLPPPLPPPLFTSPAP